MNRRSLLAATGAALAALAGCATLEADTGSGPGASGSTPTATPRDDITPRYPEPTHDADAAFGPPESTDANLEVGEQSEKVDSHGVSIENAADVPRNLELRVADRADGSIPIERTIEVSPNGGISISLLEPSDYLIDLGVPAKGTGASIEIGPGYFDCNASTTHVDVSDSGRVTATTFSTTMGCSTADEH